MFFLSLKDIINQLSERGMPTQMLAEVEPEIDVEFESGDGDSLYRPFWGTIEIDDLTTGGLYDEKPNAISTLYHEATHAFVDISNLQNKGNWTEFRDAMKLAKLEDGTTINVSTNSEADRAANESISRYVGELASSAWGSLTRINKLKRQILEITDRKNGQQLLRDVNLVPKVYNDSVKIATKSLGYITRFGKKIHLTGNYLTEPFKNYGRRLLEDQIHESFSKTRLLEFQYRELLMDAEELQCRVTSGKSRTLDWGSRKALGRSKFDKRKISKSR